MSKIDLHNYEAFYLDYTEGNLSTEDTAELLLFLENNPAIKSELDDFDLITLNSLENEQVDFSGLKQNINPENAEEYIIGSVEGQLNEEDELELKALIAANKHVELLANRYKKTILPKTTIPFPNKAKLKRKSGILVYMTPLRRVAAIAILLLTLTPFFIQEDAVQVADNSNSASKLETDSAQSVGSIPDTNGTAHKVLPSQTKRTDVNPLVAEKTIAKTKEQSEAIIKRIELEKVPRKTIVNIQIPKTNFELAQSETTSKPLQISEPKTETKQLFAQANEPLSVGEWLNQNIRKRIFKEEQPTEEKIQGIELLTNATKVLQEKTNSAIAFSHANKENVVSYTVSIGKFSFTRTKNN